MDCQQERVPHLLQKIELNKFQFKDYRNLYDSQYRGPSYSSRSTGKAYEVSYHHNLSQDLLLTHLELEFNDRGAFDQLFEVGQIEASKFTNRSVFGSAIRSSSAQSSHEGKNLKVSCISITQSVKLSILLKKQFLTVYQDVLGFKKQKGRQSSQENVLKMLKYAFKSINICGYHLSMNTAASELVNLLNVSQAFKHSNRFDQAAQTDILVSLSLISARRFVQAAEALRTASKFYVEKYINSKSSMDFSRIDKSWIRQQNRDQLQISAFSRSFAAGRVLEGGKYLYKAAKIELLLADTINQPTLLGDKLDAYNRANSYVNGNTNPDRIGARIDYDQICYTIGPSILPFLVKVLTDKSQIFKISALKSIQFFYESLGCTLGNFMPLIIKNIVLIYPSQNDKESILKTQQNVQQRTQTSSRIKLLLDHTNHLFQSLLSLIPGMNKKYLKLIFQQIIQISMSDEYRNDLRLYLLRFGQKIIQICSSDLEINVNYIRYIFAISQGKYSKKSDSNKHICHNLVYFSQRVADLLKVKVLKHYNKVNCLAAITNWMNDALINLCQNQSISNHNHLNHILELVISIYSNPKVPLPNLIQPIIYLLNTSLNQPKLPFQKILEAFTVLARYGSRLQGSGDLASEIIERLLSRSQMCTLASKELKILQKVLQTTKEAKTTWLLQFLECIPHSNFDQIYAIFDLLVIKSVKLLDKASINFIITTLLDQYTVKGKAHQLSKQNFISSLIRQLPGSLKLLLQLCLFQNKEPKVESYMGKQKNDKQHCFDSKQYKLHSELFGQKINLLLLVFSKGDLINPQFGSIFNNDNICKIYENIKQILYSSGNFKIKSKLLILTKHIIVLMGNLPHTNSTLISSKLLFVKALLDILKNFMTLYKDSKLQFYSLLNIGLLFQHVEFICTANNGKESGSLQFLEQGISNQFIAPFPLQVNCESIIGFQLIKLWGSLVPLLNSPLQIVREIIIFIFLFCTKNGLPSAKRGVREKLIQLFKPLLTTCLQSTDYSQRMLGIRLLALLLGLGKNSKNSVVIKAEVEMNLRHFKQFLQIVIALQDDWNQDISNCSRMIGNICISKEVRSVLVKKNLGGKKHSNFLDNSSLSFNIEDEIVFQRKQNSFDILNNFDVLMKSDEEFHPQDSLQLPELKQEFLKDISDFQIRINKIHFSSLDNMPERDSFVEEEQHYFDPNDQKNSQNDNEGSQSQEEPLQLSDVGIIDLVDDEEWGQQQNQVKITQKLPLKKVYKLSPNLGSSTKHNRLRNKRMNPAEFEENKIIVDQLQERIYSPSLPSQKSQFHPYQNKHQVIPQKQEVRELPLQEHQQSKGSKRIRQQIEHVEGRSSLSDDLGSRQVPQLRKQKKHPKKRKSSALK